MTEQDPTEQTEDHLGPLGPRFLAALEHKEEGRLDEAEEALRDILKVEPRLPEPRMELARILLDTDRLGPAEEHAREALRLLESGGMWTEMLPEDVVKSVAHALLAEVLRRHADEDDVIFGDPERFHALVAESKDHFEKAAQLDASDATANYYAFYFGLDPAEAAAAQAQAPETPEA